MKTRAAVVYEPGKRIEVEELALDGPREGEVLIRYTHAGLCHAHVHIAHGDLEARLPMVLGHEGGGIIEEVGPGVTRAAPGDHVVCSFIPNCGVCRYCATGRQSICDMGATILEGYLPGERFPITGPRGQYGAMCMIGTFSQYGVISQTSAIKVDDDLPLDKAALVGCGVPTGWGSAVNTANVSPGDTVAIYGIGGIGINAVQGARYAGAKNVIAIDPLENNRLLALVRHRPAGEQAREGDGARRDPRVRYRRGGAGSNHPDDPRAGRRLGHPHRRPHDGRSRRRRVP